LQLSAHHFKYIELFQLSADVLITSNAQNQFNLGALCTILVKLSVSL